MYAATRAIRHQPGEIHRFNQPLEIARTGTATSRIIPTHCVMVPGRPEAWAMLGEPLQNRLGQITFSTDHLTEFACRTAGN
jgi:hypothetical protein